MTTHDTAMRLRTTLAVIGLLVLHYVLAARSLLRENPTVDEVVHMPAGLTYWQKGTFRLYHHNPPLFKLAAALPVLLAKPTTEPIYLEKSWTSRSPSQTTFSQSFMRYNAGRYLELFQLARLVMPLFTVIGGVVVFAWSARLYGRLAGLLSLSLWVFCPNILAHARLVTSDASSTAIGVAATYVFWRYLDRPTWRWTAASGVMLGLAQLSKFSMLLLYAVWPLFWLAHLVMVGTGRGPGEPQQGRAGTLAYASRGILQGLMIVAISVLVIDTGYLFEGVGTPLGRFEFGSRSLTRAVPPGSVRPRSENMLFDITWQFRVNRFRDTWLGGLPSPLPSHYLLGFDEQKIETEGIPRRFSHAVLMGGPDEVERVRETPQDHRDERSVYWVYLNGVLRNTGGWVEYYPLALLYKVPEGTWLLLVLAFAVLVTARRSRAAWFDELALATVPTIILISITLFTDINLGLRYVLGIFPYLFIATGKVVPWCLGLREPWRRVTAGVTVGSLALTITASLWIAPSYLSYFNWASGGPDRVPARLIDSNLDWGQDLVELRRWWEANIPNEPIGLAYFGQINPSIFALRDEPFRWFLAPGQPGSIRSTSNTPSPRLVRQAPALTPGYYAVSATLLHGLPWRLYDPAPLAFVPEATQPAWDAHEPDAYGYFRWFRPIKTIGHSIHIYHLTADDVARVSPALEPGPGVVVDSPTSRPR